MIVSVFKDKTYATGVDFSYTPGNQYIPAQIDDNGNVISPEVPEILSKGNPDCIACIEIDFNPSLQYLEIGEKRGKLTFNIQELPPKEESREEKKTRKIQEFISIENVNEFDWEGVEVSESDYSNLIILRDFQGDNGAQQAMLAKTDAKHIAMFLSLGVPKETIQAVYADEISKMQEISKTRVALGLSPFDLSFLN